MFEGKRLLAIGRSLLLRDRGANLRNVLLEQGIELYNGNAKIINCRGIGSCGTCAVEIEGEVSAPNWQEKARKSFPPHSPTSNRRLACQTQVLGNIKIRKYNGFWGQGQERVWSEE